MSHPSRRAVLRGLGLGAGGGRLLERIHLRATVGGLTRPVAVATVP